MPADGCCDRPPTPLHTSLNLALPPSHPAPPASQVLHACALELDLQILPAGDQSKAGLRGINLSGGQRQRLNLARSAYYGGDLVLLDNALSAVDHHTAHHIFEHCVRGIFRDKATVLVTHQVGLWWAGGGGWLVGRGGLGAAPSPQGCLDAWLF